MSVPEGYKSLGKIGISYKGDYNSNTAYERLDAVFHNGSTYLAIKDAPDGAPRNDKINWIYLAKGYDGETVDVAETEIAFTESETRENIGSGEKVSTVFGKIKKFFTDLTAPAFAQMITSKDDLLATKAAGYVPDAKAVADTYTELNGKLDNVESEQLADGLMIYRYGKLRILYFSNYVATVNGGSFQSLNALLKKSDKPRYNVSSCNVNASLNDKYGILYIQISTSGLFTGFVVDDSQSKGYRYITGNPHFNGNIVYLVL